MPGKRKYTRKPKVSKAIKKYVKSNNKKLGETKYVIISNNATVFNPVRSSTNMDSAYPIPQGSGIGDREGLKISPSSLTFTFTLYKGITTDASVRFLVIRFNDNLSAISTNTLFDSINDGNVNYVNNFMSNNKSVRRRFDVLYDKTYTVDDAKTNQMNITAKIKVNAKPINFAGTSGTGNAYGQIYYTWLSDNALATSPSIFYTLQARYKDL